MYSGILSKGLFGLFCIFWYTFSRYIYSFLFPEDITMDMNHHRQQEWNYSIKKMFGSISRRYDILNTLMTFGQDRLWRRRVVQQTKLRREGILLDVGAGTGMIALEALRHNPELKVVAADLTLDMMKVGREYAGDKDIMWCCTDALRLPFHDKTFDAAASGYLIRNVPDIRLCFSEQFRVIKPGGKVVCLDTSPPQKNMMRPFVLFHLKIIIPLLGGLISGKWGAYRYLPESTRSFKTPQEITRIMETVGFKDITYQRYMFGTIVIIKGTRP
jgi:demethylmenaquinone methyltransferase/2-methoxy-6-polyprenyl-1,4-benzoquinol methylase